jgi:hypothetical protein
MSQPAVTLDLPEDLYERVRRAAKGMKQPVEQALVKIVRAAAPSLEQVPMEYRTDLEALEELEDEDLWRITKKRFPAGKQQRLTNLLQKNEGGRLTPQDRQALTALRTEADRLMLRRSYAFLLLKFRGHRIPSLAELKA